VILISIFPLLSSGNYWTVFKGMPEAGETPQQTAVREFCEETGSVGVLPTISDGAPILKGRTSAKDLVIFLQDGSGIPESIFDIDKVVKIDSGYMEGKPEIIGIRYLTLEEALSGTDDGAKIYKSQENILQQAQTYLVANHLI